MARSAELVRPRRGRMIAGVCAALARRFDMKPWQVRLIFMLSCLLPGPQFLLYIALWIILPAE
jgi:phage shock protein PspC (stress-responsive transcriptional regulator)